ELVVPLPGASASSAEPSTGVLCQCRRVPVRLAELRPQHVRLLEVVAGELVEVDDPALLQPIGEALVELRAQALRRRAVGGLLDEAVPEAEDVLAGRPDEAPSRESPQVGVGGRRRLRVEEGGDIVGAELLADDGAALEDGPLAWAEAVEAGREERLHGLREL